MGYEGYFNYVSILTIKDKMFRIKFLKQTIAGFLTFKFLNLFKGNVQKTSGLLKENYTKEDLKKLAKVLETPIRTTRFSYDNPEMKVFEALCDKLKNNEPIYDDEVIF